MLCVSVCITRWMSYCQLVIDYSVAFRFCFYFNLHSVYLFLLSFTCRFTFGVFLCLVPSDSTSACFVANCSLTFCAFLSFSFSCLSSRLRLIYRAYRPLLPLLLLPQSFLFFPSILPPPCLSFLLSWPSLYHSAVSSRHSSDARVLQPQAPCLFPPLL